MILFHRFAWIVASRLLAALLQAVTLVLIARNAGPSLFGVLAAFLGLVVILQVVSDCGIATYITRLRAKQPDAPQIAVALKVHQCLGVLACVLLVGTAILVAYIGDRPWWSLILLAVAGYLERQSDVRLTLALADGDVWKNAINLVLRRMVTLLMVIVGGYMSIDAILTFGIASFVAAVISLLMSRKMVRVQGTVAQLGLLEFRSILLVSRSFWVNSIGVQLRNLDVFLIAALATPAIAGYYGAIARSLNPLMMISSSLASVLLPMVARSDGRVGKSLLAPVGGVLGLVSAFYIGMAIYADKLVPFLFGSQFTPAVSGFRVVLVGLIFASVSSLLSSFLQARGFEKYVGRVSILTSVVSLSGIVIGVVLAGVLGATVGLVVAYVVQATLLFVVTFRTNSPGKES